MPSPSSTHAAGGKRKRSAVSTRASESTDTSVEPKAQDGSDAESDPADASPSSPRPRTAGGLPPHKRQRANNGTANARASNDTSDNDDAEDEDVKVMGPPPIGKLIHPIGYRTNSPPSGRAVRVYADGVFDLFHLGYVLSLPGLFPPP